MSWAGKPNESTLPSNIEATTPRQGNVDSNKDHHNHHNNLADAVKEIATQIDDAIGSNDSLSEAISGSNIVTYVTIAETTDPVERAGRDPQATINDTLQDSLLPGYQLNTGDKIIVFGENEAATGVYTVGTGPSYTWVKNVTQPTAGSFLAAGPKSVLAGKTYIVDQEGVFQETTASLNSIDADSVIFTGQVDQYDEAFPTAPTVADTLNHIGEHLPRNFNVVGTTLLIPGFADSGLDALVNDPSDPAGAGLTVTGAFEAGDKILVVAYLDPETALPNYIETGIYTVGSGPSYTWTRDALQPVAGPNDGDNRFIGDRIFITGPDKWFGQFAEVIAISYGGGTAFAPPHLTSTLQIASTFIGEYFDATIQRTSGRFAVGSTAVVNSLVERGEAPTITGWYQDNLELFTADDGHVILNNAELDAALVLGYADGSGGGFIRDLRGQLWNANFSGSETSSFLKVISGRFVVDGAKVITVDNLPSGFSGSGGPIVDFGDGTGMMVLHLETDYYQKLGAAKVVCDEYGPVSVTYVGDLITPEISQPEAEALEITAFQGAGILLEDGAYTYTYFPDWESDGTYVETTVARCLTSDIVDAIGNNEAPEFLKWDGSGYTQPGDGGAPTGITNGPRGSGDIIKLPDGRWLFATTDSYGPTDWRIIYRFATDPVTWSDFETLVEGDGNEWIYGTLWSGDPANPKQVTRDHVLFLWTVSDDPNFRWDTNRIQQLEIRPREIADPVLFDVACVATVFDGELSGSVPTLYMPNGTFASATTEELVEDDKVLVTVYIDGTPNFASTGIYTVGPSPSFAWTRDQVQPNYAANGFPGDQVRSGPTAIDIGCHYVGEYVGVESGTPLIRYLPVGGSLQAAVAATAIGETYDPSTGGFSDSFDAGTVALLNGILSDEALGVPFTPTTGGDWTTSPATVQAALDELASRIAALEP